MFANIVFLLLRMKLILQYEILEFNLPGFQKSTVILTISKLNF